MCERVFLYARFVYMNKNTSEAGEGRWSGMGCVGLGGDAGKWWPMMERNGVKLERNEGNLSRSGK